MPPLLARSVASALRVLWLLLVGCGGGSPGAPSSPEVERRTLTVLAASSLTEAFTELAAVFEAGNAGVDVRVSFAGSQTLATQVRHGLQADVFASADPEHAEDLVTEGLLEAPRPFARNRLVLAVAPGLEVPRSLSELPLTPRLVLGAPEVPAGRYAEALLDAAEEQYGAGWRAGVEARVVSREPSVRQALAKVSRGEATAGLVYATDLAAADAEEAGVRAVSLPSGLAPDAILVQGVLRGSAQPRLAGAWLTLLDSPSGQATLAAHGFLPPDGAGP